MALGLRTIFLLGLATLVGAAGSVLRRDHQGQVAALQSIRQATEQACAIKSAVHQSPIEDPPAVGPSNGSLVIGGGGTLDTVIWKRFLELAGGPEAPIVIVPTASSFADRYCSTDDCPAVKVLRSVGAKNVSVVHTNDRDVADSDEFVAPLKRARGVWITGGNQWRLVAAYIGTQTQRALAGVLDRGGVIGGTSAGATIQGVFASFPGRGATPYEPGFGFLRNVAIDQHLLARHRENDLVHVVRDHPDLLGIGIDEATAVIVQDDCMDVVGDSKVAIYDPTYHGDDDERPYYFLSPGDRFNLRTRTDMRDEESADGR